MSADASHRLSALAPAWLRYGLIAGIIAFGCTLAANLAVTFQELDAARPNTVRQVPSETTIAGWIDQAGKLAKIVTH